VRALELRLFRGLSADRHAERGEAEKGEAEKGEAEKGEAEKGEAEKGEAEKGEAAWRTSCSGLPCRPSGA